MYDRRTVLKGLAATSFILTTPSIARAKTQNLRVTIDAYVDNIPGDIISRSFYENPKDNLFVKTSSKVRDFYSKVGKPFDLPGVDLEFNFHRGSLRDKNASEIYTDKRKIRLYHTTIDELISFYTKNPRRSFFDMGGETFAKSAENIVNRAFRYFMFRNPRYKRKKKEIHKFIWINLVKVMIKENKFHLFDGIGSEYSHTAYVFPYIYLKYTENEDEFTNMSATVNAHEIGHTLNLGHPAERKSSDPKNLMDVDSMMEVKGRTPREILRPILEFDLHLTEQQVRQINSFLR